MSVRHTWRKKLNHYNSSNEVDVNLPTLMPKPQSPINEPTTHSNHVLLQSYSLPLSDSYDTNVGQASISPSINQPQTQPPFPHLLVNPHVASVLHAQTPLSPQGDNHPQPLLPPFPSREMIMNNINQLQDLSNLLAMHLSQCNTSSSHYSPNLPHTINLDQVEQHDFVENLSEEEFGYAHPSGVMTTSSASNSVFRGVFEKQKLTGPNFIDWYRKLRIVLSIKDNLNYLEQPLPPALVAPEGVKNFVCSTSSAGASSECVRISLLQAGRIAVC
ncbi:hypothetical protein Tco_0209892 [Tanacetum coccineum]